MRVHSNSEPVRFLESLLRLTIDSAWDQWPGKANNYNREV